MQTAGQVRFTRYDWGVGDVERFGKRADEVVAGLLGMPAPKDLPEVDWDAVQAESMEEWRREKAAVLLRGLDPKYRNAEPRHEMSRKWLAAYREGRYVNLGVFGPTGVGKTWEAAGIARYLLETDFTPVLMVHVNKLLDLLAPIEDRQSVLMQYSTTPVLVIDDLGAEGGSEFAQRMLYQLADYRHNHHLPTIVTSNLKPGEVPADADRGVYLETRYSDRLLRRLFEGAAQLMILQRPPGLPAVRFGAEL